MTVEPQTEPNELPPLYLDWQDWRETYAAHVKDFNSSPNTYSDRVLLEIKLKHLGFVGLNLFTELQHICTPATQSR